MRSTNKTLDYDAQRTLAELIRSEERLREAHSLVRIGGWETSEDWKAVLSPEAAEILGIEDLAGFSGDVEDFYALLHPDDQDRVRAATRDALNHSDRYTTRYRIILKSGEVRHLRDSAVVRRNNSGAAIGLNGVVQDITEQVETDRMLRQAEHFEEIGVMASGLAHDFGNTLSVIMASAELLKKQKTYNDQSVNNIIEAAEQGSRVIRNMLNYARKIPLNNEFIDLVDTVRGYIEHINDTLGDDIQIEFRSSVRKLTVFTDRDRLNDTLLNLVLNSKEAMEEKGLIQVCCGSPTEFDLNGVTLPEGDLEGFGVIILKDTGRGMTEDELGKAIQPFYSTKGLGSGLGLAMVSSFVSQSNGHFSLSSALGEGTTMAMFFPTS